MLKTADLELSGMSSFIDSFQGLYLFFEKFQGSFSTENLLIKPSEFEP